MHVGGPLLMQGRNAIPCGPPWEDGSHRMDKLLRELRLMKGQPRERYYVAAFLVLARLLLIPLLSIFMALLSADAFR
jgi:hypothetical protein